MTFNFLLQVYDFGLCVCWTEYQENGCSLCLYPCCSLSNQHFGSSPETCCPNLVLTVPPVFSCSDGFACQRLFEWHTVAFVLPCRLLQGIPFFVFFFDQNEKCIDQGKKLHRVSVSVLFPSWPHQYFYPNRASSENLASLFLFLFVPLVVVIIAFQRYSAHAMFLVWKRG